MVNRKKPFSVKQKKAQLQERRARKRNNDENNQDNDDFDAYIDGGGTRNLATGRTQESADTAAKSKHQVAAKKTATSSNSSSKPAFNNRLTSQFDKLTRVEIEANKKQSMQPIEYPDTKQALTMSFDAAYSVDVNIPVRPPWKYGESRETVEAREAAYFAEWKRKLVQETQGQFSDSVSLYEKNLEVWRQLWRVVEISDILLLVVDIRHPVLHFPPSLYRYAAETMGKPMVVVLNKTDLVAPETTRAWMHYFKASFPSVVLTTFCCYRDDKTVSVDNDASVAQMKLRRKRPRRRVYDTSLVGGLFEACRSVCDPKKLDLVDWDQLIARYTAGSDDDEEEDDNRSNSSGSDNDEDGEDSGLVGKMRNAEIDGEEADETNSGGHGETVSGKHVTIGFVGHPNVGKSTVINSIMNRTVVSTSRTPGHTKHFQTIHVTPILRLCDCPGLVFPCVVNRPLQVLAGLFNIAQVQEPYTSVLYLAQRVPLEKVLALKPPSPPENDAYSLPEYKWSAWAICEAFAIDRGFYTSKAARPDVYRAALHILRWELDGRILLSFKPPGFFDKVANESESHNANGRIGIGDQLLSSDDNSGNSDYQTSDDDNDSSPHPPVAQQSMFAVLGEEDC
ncbi:hypothetical protein IWW48_004980 [Coemansia sp. RSA 1200]|nr:hypothetical protein IWW48_004980 [Coemansia sp. RSA 1200]